MDPVILSLKRKEETSYKVSSFTFQFINSVILP